MFKKIIPLIFLIFIYNNCSAGLLDAENFKKNDPKFETTTTVEGDGVTIPKITITTQTSNSDPEYKVNKNIPDWCKKILQIDGTYKSDTESEVVICDNKILWQKDNDLNQLSTNATDKTTWLDIRNSCKNDLQCLITKYDERIIFLKQKTTQTLQPLQATIVSDENECTKPNWCSNGKPLKPFEKTICEDCTLSRYDNIISNWWFDILDDAQRVKEYNNHKKFINSRNGKNKSQLKKMYHKRIIELGLTKTKTIMSQPQQTVSQPQQTNKKIITKKQIIDLSTKYSGKYDNVPISFILSIVLLHSNGDSNNIMQITENTAKTYNCEGINTRNDLLKLETNFECGVKILSGLILKNQTEKAENELQALKNNCNENCDKIKVNVEDMKIDIALILSRYLVGLDTVSNTHPLYEKFYMLVGSTTSMIILSMENPNDIINVLSSFR